MEEELKSIDVEQATKTEPTQPANVEQEPKIEPFRPQKPAKKSRVKAILITLLALVLIGASAAAAYYYRDKVATDFEKTQTAKIKELEKDKAALDKKLAESKTTTTTTTPAVACVAVAPNATTLANIKASITSGNTAALEGYMAPTVNVIIAASEGLGPKTPAQAVSAISSFITSDLNSWDYNFALPAATLTAYRAGFYKQYFPATATIGKATNNKVISFSYDCNSKISTVFLASDASLLD